MATVTGFTAEKMLEIENDTVVDGNVVSNDLILVTRGGTQINAGSVRGPQGIQGVPGAVPSVNDQTGAVYTPRIFANKAALDSGWAGALTGMLAWTTAENNLYIRRGSVWRFLAGDNNPTYASVYRSVVQNVGTSPWKCGFDTKELDFGNCWSTTAYEYTVPYTGILEATGVISFITVQAGDAVSLGAFVAGNEVRRLTGGIGANSLGYSNKFSVTAGQKVDIRAYSPRQMYGHQALANAQFCMMP